MKQAFRLIIAAMGLILCGRLIYNANDVKEVYLALAVTPIFFFYALKDKLKESCSKCDD
jgi:hypothetical protein